MIDKGAAVQGVHPKFIDMEVGRRLDRLRKCRVFGEFDAIEESRGLIASLEEGELALASEEQKGTAFSWCARVLSSAAPDDAAEDGGSRQGRE